MQRRKRRDNPRFVITNLRYKPETIYQIYRGRGDFENRIKELQHGLEIDCTSCSNFSADQFRFLMTTAAYVLMQEMRRLPGGTSLAAAQVTTQGERLFKIAPWVKTSVRRTVIHFPINHPWFEE